jgi:hypothetical protein
MTTAAAISQPLPVQLSRSEAQDLTERIRDKLRSATQAAETLEQEFQGFRRLLDEVLATKAWIPMGYATMDAYCKAEFQVGRSQFFRRALADTVREAVQEALPPGSPPVRIKESHVRRLPRDRVPEVAAKVRKLIAGGDGIPPADEADIPRIVEGAVREVAQPQSTRPAILPGDGADVVDIPAGKGLKAPAVDQATLYMVLDFLAGLPDPAEVLRYIPEGEWWQLANLDHAARWLNEFAYARELAARA